MGFADICRQGANESQRPISARTAGLGTVCSIEAFKVFLATRNSDVFFKLKKGVISLTQGSVLLRTYG